MKKTNFAKITSEIVYTGEFFKIRKDRYKNNNVLIEKDFIEATEGVLILPIDKNDNIILIKQFRPNIGTIYEVPAGAIKRDETPLQAAKRELKEEAGFIAKKWKLVSKHLNSVYEIGFNYYFIASEITETKNNPDSDETIDSIIKVSPEKALQMIQNNQIPCLRSKGIIWNYLVYKNITLDMEK